MSCKRKREDSSPDVGLSAFAAARARVGAGKKQKEKVGLDDGDEDLSRVATNASDGKAAVPLDDTFLLPSVEDDFPGSTDAEETQWDPQAIAGLSSNHNRQSSTENERPDSPHQQGALSLTFSLASAFNSTYISIGQRIDLNKGQSLAIFGQFDLEVLEGAISIYGAILTKASGKRRIYPWSVDALPIIKTVIGQGATITLYHTPTPDERVDALGRLSPLFRFHNNADKPLPDVTYVAFPFQDENDLYSTETELRTIALQCNTKDKIQGFTRLNIPRTWLQEVAKISKINRTGCIQLLVPFGVGKFGSSRQITYADESKLKLRLQRISSTYSSTGLQRMTQRFVYSTLNSATPCLALLGSYHLFCYKTRFSVHLTPTRRVQAGTK